MTLQWMKWLRGSDLACGPLFGDSCFIASVWWMEVIYYYVLYILTGSDRVTRVNDSTRVTILMTRTRLESRWKKWWLGSTRVTFIKGWLDSTWVTVNDSKHESESFSQNLWVPDGQTQFVCIQRTEHFLLQSWSSLAEIFCFSCLVELCYILRIKCPQLA